MPLRELQQPPVQEACGHYHPPPVAYYYQPFSSTDILNWQRHTLPYLEEPQAMIRLMKIIFQTHHPTWDDIIQLLVSLFSTEERHRILTEARKWLREIAPQCTANLQLWAELATPNERPTWDCNTEKGRGHLERYRVAILQGLERGTRKPISRAKPSEVIERESKSPSEFYERLCEGCRLYTPIDPEAARSQMVINAACVSSLPQKCQMGGTPSYS